MEFENPAELGKKYTWERLDLQRSLSDAIHAVKKKIDSGEITKPMPIFFSPSAVPSIPAFRSEVLALTHGAEIIQHFLRKYPNAKTKTLTALKNSLVFHQERRRYPFWQEILEEAELYQAPSSLYFPGELSFPSNPIRISVPETPPQKEDDADALLKKAQTSFILADDDHRLRLTQSESDTLSQIFSSYTKAVESKDSSRGRTIGAEIELFNSQVSTAEMRPTIFTLPNIHDFLEFHKRFSRFLQEKYQTSKSAENPFVEYPYFNLHLNFGLLQSESELARDFLHILDDISYSYALAYDPSERIVYLEYHIGGRGKTSSIDKDIIKVQQEQSARFQTRYFTIGGSRAESVDALHGILKVCCVLNSLLKNEKQLLETQVFLKKSRPLHDVFLELKWIVEHFLEVDKIRSQPGFSDQDISNIDFQKMLDQDCVSLRMHYRTVQKRARALLSEYFAETEYDIDEE